MKKTLLALAVLGTVAGSAMAADVTLYGRIDTGLRYTYVDSDFQNIDDASSFEMTSGNYTGSRFGLKGEEDLGNGLKVAFVLENGFDSDDGSFNSNDNLFGRQASLHLKGGFGELAFGRMGILNSTAGTFGIGNFNPFATGWGDVGSQTLLWGAGFSSRLDNMITYATPEFAGVKVYAQYSFGENTDAKEGIYEGKSSTDRYYALGANMKMGGLNAILIVDSINNASWDGLNNKSKGDVDDTVRVTLGGSYDFGVVKPYLSAAYFKDGTIGDIQKAYANIGKDKHYISSIGGYWDGFGVALGASMPLAGGTAHAMLGYMSAENQAEKAAADADDELDRWMIGFGYEYPLSKRTLVYADAGYVKDSYDAKLDTQKDIDPSFYQAAVGLVHYF